MTVMIIATGITADYNASYCARLIEQGVAVPVPQEQKRGKRKKAEVTEDVTEEQDS